MYKQVKKSKENKSSVVANTVSQKKRSEKQNFGFEDNRSEIGIQSQKPLPTILPIQAMWINQGGKQVWVADPPSMHPGANPQGMLPQWNPQLGMQPGVFPQGMLPQGYPPQGMQPGVFPQGMLPQGYPPQGIQPGVNPQGMLPQGYPPQGMQPGVNPQGMLPHGNPPQGLQPGVNPQGMLPQGNPQHPNLHHQGGQAAVFNPDKGHFLDHVYSEENLKKRPFGTFFKDKNTAETIREQVLNVENQKIISWMSEQQGSNTIKLFYNGAGFLCYHKDENRSHLDPELIYSRVEFLLMKEGNEYHVVTGFPFK
jgi:hypothetical protein